jgi:hypothetical protein
VFDWWCRRKERFHFYFLDVWFTIKDERSGSWSLYIIFSQVVGMLPLHENNRMQALSSLLPSTLIWFSNQTKNGASTALFYSSTKKWGDSVLIAKHKIERLHSQKLEWSRSILLDSPTKGVFRMTLGSSSSVEL